MDDDARTAVAGRIPPAPDAPARLLEAGMALAALGVALVTLLPSDGGGWAWGPPLVEARWYLAGLDSDATRLQLLGNLALLAPLGALAALRWRVLRRPGVLAAAGLVAGGLIEVLQWALPLGRVVSPLDAALNAAGAVAAGSLVAVLSARVRAADRRRCPGIAAPSGG